MLNNFIGTIYRLTDNWYRVLNVDDYKNKPFTGDDLNVRVHYLDRSHGWSTTKYKKMISDVGVKNVNEIETKVD